MVLMARFVVLVVWWVGCEAWAFSSSIHFTFGVRVMSVSKFIGRSRVSVFGKLTAIHMPDRANPNGNPNSGFLKYHLNVGLDSPVVMSKFTQNYTNDDLVRELSDAIENDRATVMVEGYIQPNAGRDGAVFMNLTATSFTLVGEQPDVESTNIHADTSGTIIAGSAETVATDDEATVVEEKATEKPKRVRAAKKVDNTKDSTNVDSKKPF